MFRFVVANAFTIDAVYAPPVSILRTKSIRFAGTFVYLYMPGVKGALSSLANTFSISMIGINGDGLIVSTIVPIFLNNGEYILSNVS